MELPLKSCKCSLIQSLPQSWLHFGNKQVGFLIMTFFWDGMVVSYIAFIQVRLAALAAIGNPALHGTFVICYQASFSIIWLINDNFTFLFIRSFWGQTYRDVDLSTRDSDIIIIIKCLTLPWVPANSRRGQPDKGRDLCVHMTKTETEKEDETERERATNRHCRQTVAPPPN